MAIVEREMRRFRRSPLLIVMSMVFPLAQLIVLGYAFGGNVKHLKLAIVDQDRGVPAVRIRELANAVSSGAHTLDLVDYTDSGVAMADLRNGAVNGVLMIPPGFSRRSLQGNDPRIALVSDNTDNFVFASLGATMNSVVAAFNAPATDSRISTKAGLDVVEIYPYVPYIQYLLPGSITMSIFMMVMIGGGIIYIDDKARGLHEGYLVTPVTKLELVAGFNLSGTLKAFLAGGAESVGFAAAAAHLPGGRHDGVRTGQPDVPADGADDRSAGAARDVRGVEHGAVFPERRGLSTTGLSRLDARDRDGGPVHLFGARVQEPAAEKHRLRRDRLRPALPRGVLGGGDDRGDAAV
jgi:hypothetical protein